jgi:hypothetical protein
MTYTYSTSGRVNGFSHPLDGRLGGYYRGPLPHVPHATGYGPMNLDMT